MSDQAKATRISDDELLAKAIPIPHDEEEEAIELADEEDIAPAASSASAAVVGSSKIRTFDNTIAIAQHGWKRRTHANGSGAIRMKTFVAKLRPEALEHMDEQINQWLDAHPEYEVKLVSSSIGTLTGKVAEEALFVTVWV